MWSDEYEQFWLASHGPPEKPQETPAFTWQETHGKWPVAPVDKHGDMADCTPFPVGVFLSAERVWNGADKVSIYSLTGEKTTWDLYSLRFLFKQL